MDILPNSYDASPVCHLWLLRAKFWNSSKIMHFHKVGNFVEILNLLIINFSHVKDGNSDSPLLVKVHIWRASLTEQYANKRLNDSSHFVNIVPLHRIINSLSIPVLNMRFQNILLQGWTPLSTTSWFPMFFCLAKVLKIAP